MCGLVGFFGRPQKVRNYSVDKRGFISQGLYLSALRGQDATGMAFIRDLHQSPLIYKRPLPAADFLQLKMTDKILADADDCVGILGHTRSATKGWVSEDNAHPFQHKHITLIHNGHITNHKQVGGKDFDHEVDSAFVAAGLADVGEIPTLEKLIGDYALVWHNAQDGTINIARNAGRTLFWINVPKWEGVAFCSEQEMLGMLLSRNNVTSKDKTFWYPDPHVLFKFNPNSMTTDNKMEYATLPFVPRTTFGRPPPNVGSAHIPAGPIIPIGIPKTKLLDLASKASLVELALRYKNITKNQAKDSSRPTTEKQIMKASRRLKAYGFQYDTVWAIKLEAFIPYKGSTEIGVGVGHFTHALTQDIVAEINNISPEIYHTVKKMPTVLGNLVNIRTYADNDRTVCMELNDPFLKRAIEAEMNSKKFIGPNGELISWDKFQALTVQGCAVCTGHINERFTSSIRWSKDGYEVLCHECANNPKVVAEYGQFFEAKH